MLQITLFSWLECQQASRFHCKRCHLTKTFKSLARIIRSRDTILSRFMASAMAPWTTPSQASRVDSTGWSEIRTETLCSQENRTKRLLWKHGLQHPSVSLTRVTTRKVALQVTSSSRGKSSRTRPMRTHPWSHLMYHRQEKANLRLTKRIAQASVVSLARRTYLQTVPTTLNSSNRSNLLWMRTKMQAWPKLQRISAQIRSEITFTSVIAL